MESIVWSIVIAALGVAASYFIAKGDASKAAKEEIDKWKKDHLI